MSRQERGTLKVSHTIYYLNVYGTPPTPTKCRIQICMSQLALNAVPSTLDDNQWQWDTILHNFIIIVVVIKVWRQNKLQNLEDAPRKAGETRKTQILKKLLHLKMTQKDEDVKD